MSNQSARFTLALLFTFSLVIGNTCANNNNPSLRLGAAENRELQQSTNNIKTCLQPPTTTEICYNLTAYGWDPISAAGDPGPWDPWAGSVCVSLLGASDTLQVSYQTISYWKMWETAVWTGNDLSNLPTITSTKDGTTITKADLTAFPHQSKPRFNIGQDKASYNIQLTSESSCPRTIITNPSTGATTTVYNYDLMVVAYAHIGEPKGFYPNEWIDATNYTAWGNNIDDDDSIPAATTKYLYFEVPISCGC